jgi:hypothetical protein
LASKGNGLVAKEKRTILRLGDGDLGRLSFAEDPTAITRPYQGKGSESRMAVEKFRTETVTLVIG